MNRIKELRVARKLSQNDLAKEMNVAQNTISNWENGNRLIDTETLQTLAHFFEVTTDYLLGRDVNTYDNIIPIQMQRIPLLGNIACGEPIYADQDFDSYVECGADVQADFALRCKGDSMINARILDGDLVFVRKAPMVDNGKIAAVIIDDEATLKRVYVHGKTITLMAENPKYAPLVYTKDDFHNVIILGEAIAFQSDVI